MYRPATSTAPRHYRPRRTTAIVAPIPAPCIGTIVDVDPDGRLMITSHLHPLPVAARFLEHVLPLHTRRAAIISRQVFVAFDSNDLRHPIILGLLSPLSMTVGSLPEVARLDAREIDLRGETQITLRCGQASITLRKDGKIILRGTHLLSRSSGPIRIKGGHVEIN